jgi:hypothetical protein
MKGTEREYNKVLINQNMTAGMGVKLARPLHCIPLPKQQYLEKLIIGGRGG